MYKYKDELGNWVYSDKKPEKETKFDEIKPKFKQNPISKPNIYVSKTKEKNILLFKNPYFAPIELRVKSTIFKNGRKKIIVPANSSITLYESKEEIPQYWHYWVLGNPKTKIEPYQYHFPVTSRLTHEISQSFIGKFSHSKRPNLYAVDIAMQIGTYISAARGGTVIWVKDDYHMGGAKKYFLDKANYVNVLHEDGSYAVYAHILMGTSLVKPGDKVKAGDILARSGSSGYSTGPHLHFVIRKNSGLKTESVKFVFKNNKEGSYTPQKGMIISGRPKSP